MFVKLVPKKVSSHLQEVVEACKNLTRTGNFSNFCGNVLYFGQLSGNFSVSWQAAFWNLTSTIRSCLIFYPHPLGYAAG